MKHAKRMPTDAEVRAALDKLRRATGVSPMRSFVEWAVERAGEELTNGSLPGFTRSFLEALVEDGKKLLAEREPKRERSGP